MIKTIKETFKKIKNFFKKEITFTGEEFVIADTHFCDQKMMKIYGRNFPSWKEMNIHIQKTWNELVSPIDTVIFCGDFAKMKYHEDKIGVPNALRILYELSWWKMHFIEGNHDVELFFHRAKNRKFIRHKIFQGYYNNTLCVFVHKPEDVLHMNLPENTLVFHGHLHGKSTTIANSAQLNNNVILVDVGWESLKRPVRLKELYNKHKNKLNHGKN